LLLDGWFNAHDGSAKDAEVHPGDGDLHAMDPDTKEGGDYVVITGDWVYDAAHAGWTELHPAKSVQKIPHNWLEDDDPTSVQAFKDVFNRWCTLAHQADDPSVRDAQANPENEWALHPTVDGCQPAGTPPPIG
jgi:hypothetical protein